MVMGETPLNNTSYELLLTNFDWCIVGDLVGWLAVDGFASWVNGLLTAERENDLLN